MPKNTQVFDYSVDESVMIKSIRKRARIRAIVVNRRGTRYACTFWEPLHRKLEWLLDSTEIWSAPTPELGGESAIEFWSKLLSAWKAKAINPKHFRVEVSHAARGAVAKHKPVRWQSYELFFHAPSVIAEMQSFMAKQGQQVEIDVKDLRDRISKNPYWIKGKLRKRLEKAGNPAAMPVWGIYLDEHLLGYCNLWVDDEYHKIMKCAGLEDKRDPRQGPLFEIVNTVLKAQAKKP
jgi:hypothetical protein